jgi:non-homologous end joining protein Ku
VRSCSNRGAKAIVVWTLRYGDEVRDKDAYLGEIDNRNSDSKVMLLIQQLIKKQVRRWDSSLVSDPVQQKLLESSRPSGRRRSALRRRRLPNRRLRGRQEPPGSREARG